MLYVLHRQGARVYELKTDSVLYRPMKRAKKLLQNLEFRDLNRLRDQFDPIRQKRLDQYSSMGIIASSEQVFRCDVATEKDPMKMQPQGPKRVADYEHREFPWRDLTELQAEEAVMRGESLLVLGIAGTGKTHFAKKLVELLEHTGKKVDRISKTHCASERIKGVTADHYVRRYVLHGISTCDTVWVDEFGQIEHSIWCELNKLEKQWIISGDENQFRPIWSSYRGVEVDEERLHESRFLHGLTGGNRLVLRECKRSDGELFSYYSSLIPGGARFHTPLPQVLEEARALFSFEGPARHNLVISHKKRIKLNRELNIFFHKPGAALFIKAKASPGQLCAAQPMWIWPGLEVLGCTQSGKKVRNNVLYTVTSCSTRRRSPSPLSILVSGVASAMPGPMQVYKVRSSRRVSGSTTRATRDFRGNTSSWRCLVVS
jgi:hypothetical protein